MDSTSISDPLAADEALGMPPVRLAHAPSGFGPGALRLATGAACIYAFGLACGAGDLSIATFGRAVGLVATPVIFAVFFAPSLWVILTLFDLPFAARDVAQSAIVGVESMGAMLGGLVPAALFFELTSGGESGSVVAMLLEGVAAAFAGLIGLARFKRRLLGGSPTPSVANLLVAGFFGLAIVFGCTYGPDALMALHGRH